MEAGETPGNQSYEYFCSEACKYFCSETKYDKHRIWIDPILSHKINLDRFKVIENIKIMCLTKK